MVCIGSLCHPPFGQVEKISIANDQYQSLGQLLAKSYFSSFHSTIDSILQFVHFENQINGSQNQYEANGCHVPMNCWMLNSLLLNPKIVDMMEWNRTTWADMSLLKHTAIQRYSSQRRLLVWFIYFSEHESICISTRCRETLNNEWY